MRAREVQNPPNPWASHHVEWLGEPPTTELKVYEEEARTILSENQSPDLPFRYGLNPYRGCFHGCVYCYARPTHQYLDWGAGSDFERRIVVKTNAAKLLEEGLKSERWKPDTIVFSGVTDCYQPLEASYELTRRCLEACAERRNPVGIVTKGALICRDIDILSEMATWNGVRVFLSIPFASDEMGKKIEPFATTISQRFRAVERLAKAGVDVGVSLAPMVPGLNDEMIPTILEEAAKRGARRAFLTVLRLPSPVDEIFEGALREALPERADRVLSALRDLRGGDLSEHRFGERMVGKGPRWIAIRQLFHGTCQRVGLLTSRDKGLNRNAFRRFGQQELEI